MHCLTHLLTKLLDKAASDQRQCSVVCLNSYILFLGLMNLLTWCNFLLNLMPSNKDYITQDYIKCITGNVLVLFPQMFFDKL